MRIDLDEKKRFEILCDLCDRVDTFKQERTELMEVKPVTDRGWTRRRLELGLIHVCDSHPELNSPLGGVVWQQ